MLVKFSQIIDLNLVVEFGSFGLICSFGCKVLTWLSLDAQEKYATGETGEETWRKATLILLVNQSFIVENSQ